MKSDGIPLINAHKVYLGYSKKISGYIDTNSGRKRISSHDTLFINIEYIHWINKIVTYKKFTLHPQSNRNYIILIELRNQHNIIKVKELIGTKIKEVDIDRIGLYW